MSNLNLNLKSKPKTRSPAQDSGKIPLDLHDRQDPALNPQTRQCVILSMIYAPLAPDPAQIQAIAAGPSQSLQSKTGQQLAL